MRTAAKNWLAPVMALWTSVGAAGASAEPPHVDFARQVAPILEARCIRCHKPGHAKGDFSLATAADLQASGFVVPGKPEESHLLAVLIPEKPDQRPQMPKEGPPLSAAERDLLRRWIAAGAPWPEDLALRERSKADGSWWALQPLADEPPPADVPADWADNPIDRFIFARLRQENLQPSPPAERLTLLRRVTYDLTGLPPTPAEIEAFLADRRPDAYQRLVERLLASPHYGEHWGRHWLDVVRYGESNGFERNILIGNVWPFRDYVIRSFNEDKPFDRFVLEHLAGDVLAPDDSAAQVGTAFLVCGPYDNVGNSDAVQAAIIRADTIDEMIRATGEAFLGLTIGCARCHDHKFDPLTQRDYYALYATLAGVRHGERSIASADEIARRNAALAPLQQRQQALVQQRDALKQAADEASKQQLAEIETQLQAVQRQIAAVPPLQTVWAGRFESIAGPAHIFLGGDPQRRGAAVAPSSLEVLDRLASRYALPADAPEPQRRLALARWIVAPDNPLTPRVLANRLWHYHFGTGIVETPSDFGWMGGRPTHPALLDWLARQVLEHGWRLKPLHRLIVTSQTYRQSSAHRPGAAAVDADSRLLWRFPPRRLTGEELRDTMLAVADALDRTAGGPGFRLYRYEQDNVAT